MRIRIVKDAELRDPDTGVWKGRVMEPWTVDGAIRKGSDYVFTAARERYQVAGHFVVTPVLPVQPPAPAPESPTRFKVVICFEIDAADYNAAHEEATLIANEIGYGKRGTIKDLYVDRVTPQEE